jgi:oligoribonuclease
MGRLIALDIETTGLNPDTNCILQLAMVEVDPETLQQVGEPFAMDVHDYVRAMHAKTGLLGRLAGAETRSHVQRAAMRWLDGKRCTVLGDSVHFDMAFLRVHMPALHACFSHRILDTTSIWLGLGLSKPETKNDNEHDALADALFSIEKLRSFRKQVGR